MLILNKRKFGCSIKKIDDHTLKAVLLNYGRYNNMDPNKKSNHLSVLTIWIVVALILISLMGCTPVISPKCRHYCILQALTFGEKYPVRIAVGLTSKPKMGHAQAQAFINGKWVWLDNDRALVSVGTKSTDFYPYKFVTIKEALTWSKIEEHTSIRREIK